PLFRSEGYLLRTPDGYVLGDRVDMLGRGAASRRELRVLRGLHDQPGAPAYLADLDGEEIRLTEIVDSPTAPPADLWLGMRGAAHATALGKAILGTLPVTARRDYLADHALLDLTPHTITSPRALLAELERSREVAVDRQEYAVGTVCTAVPVPGQTKAVAVSLPADRAAELPAHAAALRRAATLRALAHRGALSPCEKAALSASGAAVTVEVRTHCQRRHRCLPRCPNHRRYRHRPTPATPTYRSTSAGTSTRRWCSRAPSKRRSCASTTPTRDRASTSARASSPGRCTCPPARSRWRPGCAPTSPRTTPSPPPTGPTTSRS